MTKNMMLVIISILLITYWGQQFIEFNIFDDHDRKIFTNFPITTSTFSWKPYCTPLYSLLCIMPHSNFSLTYNGLLTLLQFSALSKIFPFSFIILLHCIVCITFELKIVTPSNLLTKFLLGIVFFRIHTIK